MALGTIIGKVAIKVVPDTRDFRGDLRQRLEAIEKSAKALKIEAKVNSLGLRRELLNSVRELNVIAKGNDAYKVKVGLRVTSIGAVGDLRRAIRELEATGQRVKVRTDLSNDVAVVPLFDELAWQKAKGQIRRWKKDVSPVRIDVVPDLNRGGQTITQARLAVLTRPRFVSIIPILKETALQKAERALAALSGGRAFKNLGQDFLDFVGNLDKSLPRLAVLTTTLTNLGAAAMTSTSNLLTLGGSIASIGPAALALPGIIGGIAIGVTAFAVAMKDFNKHFADFQIGMGRKTLAGGAWKQLQDLMSEKFWRGAEKPIGHLLKTLFPQFSKGMQHISTLLGGFTGNLAKAFTGVFDGALVSMFKDLGESIRVMGTHTKGLAGIFQKLGEVGAGNLPRLAEWTGNLADRFDAWLGRKGKAGLQSMIDDGIKALKDLGGVIRGTSSTLAGLTKAAEAAGGSTLAMLSDTMNSAAKTVNSPGFQKAFTNAFVGAHDAMRNIAKESGPQFKSFILRLTDVFNKDLPIAGRTAGKALGAIFDALDTKDVENTLLRVFKALENSVNSLAPAMRPLVRALSAIVRVAATVTETLAANLAPAIEMLAPKVESLAKDVEPLAKALGNTLGAAVKIVAAVLKVLPNTVLIAATALIGFNVAINRVKGALTGIPGTLAAVGAGFRTFGQNVNIATTTMMTAGARTERESARMASAMTGIKSAVAPLLGAAGLYGVVDAANRSNKAIGGLQGALGGAALGASIGSIIPGIGTLIGAGVGAAGGGLLGVVSSGNKAKDTLSGLGKTAERQKAGLASLRDSLNQVTGAVTGMSKSIIAKDLQDAHAFDAAKTIGINSRTLVNAAAGNEAAMKKVKAAVDAARQSIADFAAASQQGLVSDLPAEKQAELAAQANALSQALGVVTTQLGKDQSAVRGLALATANLTALYPGIPKQIITQIRQQGGAETEAQIVSLGQKVGGLTDKQVRVLLKAIDTDVTVADIARVQAAIGKTDGKKATVKTELKDDATPKMRGALDRMVGDIEKAPKRAKADLGPFKQSLAQQTAVIASRAHGQGNSIGSNLTAGFVEGIKPEVAAAAAARMAAAASAAAQAHLEIHSPSRLFRKIGQYVAQGFALGIADDTGKVESKMDGLLSLLDKAHKKGLAKMVRGVKGQLVKYASELDKIKEKIGEVQSYIDQISANIINSGSVTGQGVAGGGFADVVENLRNATKDAQAFAAVLNQLKSLKLNKTTMDQLAQAGPQAALATAQSIAAAGQSGVDTINALQGQLAAAASSVGNTAADVMFANGGHIVDGLLAGLQANEAKIEAEMVKIAKGMVKAIKKALGIKSPSRVFMGLGSYVGQGFVLGVQQQHAAAQAAILGLSAARPAPVDANVRRAMAGTTNNNKTINYYAAPGSSLGAEEDLFAALSRARGM